MSEVNDHNMQVYMDKWGSPHELIHHVKMLDGLHAGIDNALPLQRQPLGETAFSRSMWLFGGWNETLYWVARSIADPLQAGDFAGHSTISG